MKFIYKALLFLLLFFSIFRMIGENVIIGAYGAYMMFVVLIFSLIFMKVKKIEYNRTLITLTFLYLIALLFSAFFNSEIGILLQGFLFVLMVTSTTIAVNTIFKEITVKITVRLTIIVGAILIFIPLAINGFNTNPYSGIFTNPNSFGAAAVTLFAIFLSLLLSTIEKQILDKEKPKKLKVLLYLVICILCFTLVLFSASRLSFITGASITVLGLFTMFIFAIKNKLLVKWIFKILLWSPFLFLIYFILSRFTSLNYYFDTIIISKFDRKSGNTLDGRGGIWQQTFGESKMFGHGETYFDSMGLGAHNTFVHILGVYGWVPALIIVLFFIVGFYYCLKFAVTSRNSYKYLPIIILITFLGLSMAENQMYRITMVLSLILIGYVANNRKLIIKI